MKEWFEEFNDALKDSLPLLVFITWLLMVVIVVRGLVNGTIR